MLGVVMFGATHLGNAQRLIKHDFNDGSFGPYEVNKSDQKARVYLKDGAVETHWKQELYNGTNSGRKAQFRPIEDIIFTQHIWMGLRIKIHEDYMKDNPNTNAGLMQIWGTTGAQGNGNHMCMLKFDGRKGGALVWQHRYNSVKNKTYHLIEPNFPRNEFVDVVVHVQLKNRNNGIVQVWVNGELKVNETNQTIGWGELDETGMINGTHCFGTSLGQYNFFVEPNTDDSYDGKNISYDGHLEGETRTVTYDNVALYNGVDGYDLVNPAECKPFEAYAKIEAEDFCAYAGVSKESTSDVSGKQHLSSIDDGDWVSYTDFDFGTNVDSVAFRVAASQASTVELRLDSLSGTHIGTVAIPETGGQDKWETISTDVVEVSGKHDLYVLFKGEGAVINWFEFTPVEVTAIALTGGNEELKVGETVQYNASVVPTTASNQAIVWTSSDEDVAIVNSSGLVVALGEGSTTITATTEDGGFTASAEVEVVVILSGTSDSSNLQLYPNPFDTELLLEVSENAFYEFSVLDLEGMVVRQGVIAPGVSNFQVDTAGLSKGIYLVRLQGDQDQQVLKVIKK